MADAIYFHQTLTGGRVVKLVGIVHPLIFPLDRIKARRINELVAPADVVLAESKKLLPKKLAARAKIVDCRAAEKAAREFYSARVELREERQDVLKTIYRELKRTVFPLDLKIKPMPPIEKLGKATAGSPKLLATRKEIQEFEEIVVSLRSFIMLSKLLQKHFALRDREKTLVLVAGVSHTIQITCFLDKHGCFAGFAKKLLKTVKKMTILRKGTKSHLMKEAKLAVRNGRKAGLMQP